MCGVCFQPNPYNVTLRGASYDRQTSKLFYFYIIKMIEINLSQKRKSEDSYFFRCCSWNKYNKKLKIPEFEVHFISFNVDFQFYTKTNIWHSAWFFWSLYDGSVIVLIISSQVVEPWIVRLVYFMRRIIDDIVFLIWLWGPH